VATSLDYLTVLYGDQGQYLKAEPFCRRALAIREKVLGPDHPDVAKSLDYLALLYACRGQYAQAESLYESSLAIREKTLGPEHPDAATSLENYAHRTVPQLLVWAEILSKLRSSEIPDRATPN
jgi:tetratricopeptide (TPR) repeat protein